MKNFIRLLTGSGENCADIRYATAISTPDEFIYFEYNDRKCAILSALEIEANAKRHGAKANEYQYYDLNGSAAIASGMYDTSVKHMKYADIITQKFIKYKQDFPLYDEFVVLCNAQQSMCMSSERDSDAVVAFAKNKVPELTAFTLHILRLDDSGRCVVDSFIL